MDAKVFPQGVANYDPNSWSKVAGNNSLHLIEKSSLFETGSVAPCSTCTKMTKLITTEAKLQRASKYHSPCCIPSLPLHTLARHTRRARQFPRWPWVKLTETCELAPHNLWSSYDHLMIILWSSYDHLMIILWSSYDHLMIILWSSIRWSAIIIIIIIININININKHPLSVIIHILQTWSSQEMSTQHNKSCGKNVQSLNMYHTLPHNGLWQW